MSTLANSYRPLVFRDLIGQEIMVQTISNAFSMDRIANAFLFTGTHGIGKTTTARIIAKSLNCSDKSSPEPCMKCVHCLDISESAHPDVLEMDAASNTSIDDIRVILENAQYVPSQGNFRIYIIDEVHMLSKSAFNALLKALEEPYPHVKFILATTELQKVPATIISRCQRFHLHRINDKQLAQHIMQISQKENCQISQEAALLIAQSVDGSVRDALSILEQAISYSINNINDIDIQNILGISDQKKIQKMLLYLANKQASALLEVFSELYQAGGDPLFILNDLLEQLHALSKMKVTPYENAPLEELAQQFSLELLNRLWQALCNGIQSVKIAPNIYTASEMILLRLCYLSSLPSPSEIIKSKDRPGELSAEKILNLCKQHNEVILFNYLTHNLQITNISDRVVTINMIASTSAVDEFKNKLCICLKKWTNKEWGVKVIDNSQNHPMVNKLMQDFNGAKLISVKKR